MALGCPSCEEASAPENETDSSAQAPAQTGPAPTSDDGGDADGAGVPAGITQQLTASLAIAVSAETLSAMMASPDSAVAGLAEGFAEYIGVDSEYVSVESTDPDLYG